MDFDAFIAPLGSERFMAEYYGKRPVHLPAAKSGRRSILDWTRVKALLAIRSHWTEPNLNLIMNSRPVVRDHYMDAPEGGQEPRADPNKVGAFLSMGASFVGNSVEQIAPEVRELTDMLSQLFAARANANLYCSFGGIQAFASHFDPHEVFALHCEGEKVWRIYENRADAPLTSTGGGEGAGRQADRVKGGLLLEVTMRPGDLLYIPRGYFHDALASSAASLHLTFGVLPYSARILFRLLEQAALRERAFREYLPDGRAEQGALRSRLGELADRVGDIMRSPAFLAEVATVQAKLVSREPEIDLPDRPPVEAYARTDRPADVVRSDEGAVVRPAGGAGDMPLGALAEEAEWMLDQPAVVVGQLLSRFPHRGDGELRTLLQALVRAGFFVAYQPKV